MFRQALIPLRLVLRGQLGFARNAAVAPFSSGRDPKGKDKHYQGFKGFDRRPKPSKPEKQAQKPEVAKEEKKAPEIKQQEQKPAQTEGRKGFRKFGRSKQPSPRLVKENREEDKPKPPRSPRPSRRQNQTPKQEQQQPKREAQQQSSSTSNSSTGQTGGPSGKNPNPNDWKVRITNAQKKYEQQFREWAQSYRFRYHHLIWVVFLAYFFPYRQKYSYQEFLKQLSQERVTSIIVDSEEGRSKLKVERYPGPIFQSLDSD